MKFLFSLLLTSATHLIAQTYAIVTVEVTNPVDTNARFVIELDTEYAPQNISNFLLLADPKDELYRNDRTAAGFNNPSGSYRISRADGGPVPGAGEVFTISVNGNPNPFINVPVGSEARVFRSQNINHVATLRLNAETGWVHEKGPFDTFDFSVSTNSTFQRWMLSVDTSIPYLDELTGNMTNGPFYDNLGTVPLISVGGQYPYMSLGKKSQAVNQSPGWIIQNEMIEPLNNSMDSASLFGNHFATVGGATGADQRYAVAFANSTLVSPNTAASEILVTGTSGNPNFEGRHTYIGKVIAGTYRNTTIFPNTIIPSSRLLVDSILNGNRNATLKSIRYERIGTGYHPIDSGGTLPILSSLEGQPSIELLSPTEARVYTGATAGQMRFLDGSIDLQTWSRVGQSNYPTMGSAEVGFPLTINAAIPQQFFQVNPLVVNFPTWPSEDFDFNGKQLRFKGRQIDVAGAPQVLNNFIVVFNQTLNSGTLFGNGGDLDGTHDLSDVQYTATSPYEGVISMESATIPGTLKFRLYFDAHKQREYVDEIIIDRFHRLIDQVQTIPGVGDILFRDVRSEFGIWRVQN